MKFKNKAGQDMVKNERWIWGSIVILTFCTIYVVSHFLLIMSQ